MRRSGPLVSRPRSTVEEERPSVPSDHGQRATTLRSPEPAVVVSFTGPRERHRAGPHDVLRYLGRHGADGLPRLQPLPRQDLGPGPSPLTLDATDATCPVAEAVKHIVPDGADVTIELSGSYRALHEAVRATAPGGRVVAAGFYRGEADGPRLGEEFHHNRVQLIASQIGGVPTGPAGRWTPERLHRAFMGLVFDGRVDVAPLISHVVPCDEVADVYRLLDERPGEALQTVLDFRAPTGADQHEEQSA